MKDLGLIYCTAHELPPEGRAAYLTKACEGDNALRTRVEQMLSVSDEAEAFVTDLPDAGGVYFPVTLDPADPLTRVIRLDQKTQKGPVPSRRLLYPLEGVDKDT